MTRGLSISTSVVVLASATAAPALATGEATGAAGATGAFVGSAARYDRGLEARAESPVDRGGR